MVRRLPGGHMHETLAWLAVGVIVGAALLGGTFVGITAMGLTAGRALDPGRASRIIARLTAAFGVGQILGPSVAGWLAERTGAS